jgi:hypothetical protein
LHHWKLCVRQFFHPCTIILRESTDKRQQARLMVLTVEPLSMPTFEGRLQGKDDKILMRCGLNAITWHLVALG